MIRDAMSAPDTYEEFYEQYADYVYHLVLKFGVPNFEAQDVTSEIMIKILEKDYLSKFDPERTTRSANGGKARFQSFLNGIVSTYCMGIRERVVRDMGRATSYDAGPDSFTDEDFRDFLIGPSARHEFEAVEALDQLRRLRSYLDEIPVHEGQNQYSRSETYGDVFDAVVRVWSEGDVPVRAGRGVGFPTPVRAKSLAVELGISTTAASRWLIQMCLHAQEFERLEKISEKV